LETIIEKDGFREYARVYTDGSVIDEQSGCAAVMGWTDVNFQYRGTGNHRGNEDHKKMGADKRIMTDSLSNIVAQEETFTRGNSEKMVLKDLMAEEGSNLKLMWVLAHVSIKGNETADKAAKTKTKR
jgi:hypothetical protein